MEGIHYFLVVGKLENKNEIVYRSIDIIMYWNPIYNLILFLA